MWLFFSIRENTMARSWLLIIFWCGAALTGLLLLAKIVIHLALMACYRPPLEHAYKDTLVMQDVERLGLLRDVDGFLSPAFWITAFGAAVLGAGVVTARYYHGTHPREENSLRD
jgi:hypothetical protein